MCSFIGMFGLTFDALQNEKPLLIYCFKFDEKNLEQ